MKFVLRTLLRWVLERRIGRSCGKIARRRDDKKLYCGNRGRDLVIYQFVGSSIVEFLCFCISYLILLDF